MSTSPTPQTSGPIFTCYKCGAEVDGGMVTWMAGRLYHPHCMPQVPSVYPQDAMDKATNAIRDLERRLAAAHDALRPFANAAALYDVPLNCGADEVSPGLSLQNLRNARTALAQVAQGGVLEGSGRG